MQYDINREAAKVSGLSSGKNDKYEYLTVEEMLPFNRSQSIIHVQDIIKSNKLDYKPKPKCDWTYNSRKHVLPIVFLRKICERKLLLEEADKEQSKITN